MELQLAKYVSNLLILLFKSLYVDIESFFSSIQFFLQTFPMIFSTKWNPFWKTCDEALQEKPCSCRGSADGQEGMGTNMTMGRLGMAICGFEDNDEGGQDLVSVFEEDEPSLEEIKETFNVFDVNNDGFIDAGELHRVVCSLGLKERYELEDCRKMILAVDGEGDGRIEFQEFVKFMEKCLC